MELRLGLQFVESETTAIVVGFIDRCGALLLVARL